MNLGGRYKPRSLKKYFELSLPAPDADARFRNAAESLGDNSLLTGGRMEHSDIYKFNYRTAPGSKNIYENYALLARVMENGEVSKIEYLFVYDRRISLYTKVMSALCVAVPVTVAVLSLYVLHGISLLAGVLLGLVTAFGISSFFLFRENSKKAEKIIDEFEKFLVNIFCTGGDS